MVNAMLRFLLALLIAVFLSCACADAASVTLSPVGLRPSSQGGVYYITPNGNDANDGKTIAPAWYTLNHPVNCGDIVYSEPGIYAGDHFQSTKWATPQACAAAKLPYAILWCHSSVLNCFVDGRQGTGKERSAIHVGAPTWAVTGFTATANCGKYCYGYCYGTSAHHVLFINDYAHDCIWSGASTGNDYVAYIGVLLYHNAFQNWVGGGGCPSNDSDINAVAYDSAPGTHRSPSIKTARIICRRSGR
jgi:hypothetical protein